MRVLSSTDFESLVNASGWAYARDDDILVADGAICHDTDYELSGVVGAEMAELILNEFTTSRISSGLLRVRGMSSPSWVQATVVNHILSLSGYPDVPFGDFRFCFENEYSALLSIMAWCIACAWEFDFLAIDRHFIARGLSDERLAVLWDSGLPLKPTVPELLLNLEFRHCRGSWKLET